MRTVLLMTALLALSGCAATGNGPQYTADQLLHDEAFPGSSGYRIEKRHEVFGLDQAAKNQLDLKVNSIRDYHQRGRALIDEIFHQASLNLAYDSKANTTASETFHNRAGNCLSLSILAYAMARYTGFDAQFQEVDIPDYWERRDRFSLMNQHINVRFSPKNTSRTLLARQIEMEVDFVPLRTTLDPPKRTITQSRALAMFYNNKAVDALLSANHDMAYAYLKAAIQQDESLDMAFTSLGLLYGLRGHMPWAEESYRHAYRINPDNAIAAEGLATVLKNAGRDNEARILLAKLERRRANDPYYLYIMGEEAYDDGNLRQAQHYFEKAIALQPKLDQFHFALARTHLQLGNRERARFHLERAENYAAYADLKQKYRNKLAALSTL